MSKPKRWPTTWDEVEAAVDDMASRPDLAVRHGTPDCKCAACQWFYTDPPTLTDSVGIKPHISKYRSGRWQCQGDGRVTFGSNPYHAWANWNWRVDGRQVSA